MLTSVPMTWNLDDHVLAVTLFKDFVVGNVKVKMFRSHLLIVCR